MGRLTIRTKLIGLVAVFLVLFGGVIGVAQYMARIQSQDGLVIDLAGRQRTLTAQMQTDFNDVVHAIETESTVDEPRERLTQRMGLYHATLMGFDVGGQLVLSDGKTVHVDPIGGALRADLSRAIAAWESYRLVVTGIIGGEHDLFSMAYFNALDAVPALTQELLATSEDLVHRLTAQSEQRNGLLITTLMASFAVALVAAAIGVWIAWSISRPIGEIIGAMTRLADGDLAVSVAKPAARRDEIGAMAKAVEVFRAQAVEKSELEQTQRDTEQRAQAEKQAIMHRLADDFEASVGHVVESVTSASTDMRTSARSMSQIAEETRIRATSAASAVEQTSANVQTVAAAAEELGSSIAEISRQMNVQTVAADEAVDSATASESRISGLAERVDAIGNVVSLITGIAERTNLLALNATIEAARAGEAGKGFAIVASEVKNLANQTAKATEEIAGQIRGVQEETGNAVTAIADINLKIDRIREISASVAAAVEEQNAAANEICRSTLEASTGTRQVSSSIVGVTDASAEAGETGSTVLAAAEELSVESEKLSTQVASFMERVRAA